MRQRRRFAAMLAALALAAGLTAIPALATEGGSPSTYTDVENPGDGTGSDTMWMCLAGASMTSGEEGRNRGCFSSRVAP